MDCISITPRFHRDELYKCVNRPLCLLLKYQPGIPGGISSQGTALQTLAQICREANPSATLDKTNPFNDIVSLPNTLEKHLEQFWKKAVYLCEILGSWSAEFFIAETVKILGNSVMGRKNLSLNATESVKCSLLGILDLPGLDTSYRAGLDSETFNLSPKAQCLITFLAEQPLGTTTGIIFVQRRVTTAVICHLLSTHPRTKDRFRCAPFVGSSNDPSRKYSLGELLDLKAQKEVLERFRTGEINLLVATNALEEGIDVQSCNLVVCFDPPSNLKSFIQRRGRARREKSTLAIMASTEDDSWKMERWQALEAELVRICQSDREAGETWDAALDGADGDVDFKLIHPKTK